MKKRYIKATEVPTLDDLFIEEELVEESDICNEYNEKEIYEE